MIDTIYTFHDNMGVRLILLVLAILYFICALAPFMKKYEDNKFVQSFRTAVVIVGIVDVSIIIAKYVS